MPLYDAPSYTGTAAERWALAGLDAATGRITAEELHALGTELFRVFAAAEEERCEQRGLVAEWMDRAADLESDLQDALRAVRDLDDLKAQIRHLEGKP